MNKLKLKSLAKSGFWVYLNYFTNLMVGFLLTYLYANFVSKEIFGQFNFILSILSMLGIFSLVGMNQALTFAISEGFHGNFQKAVNQTLKFSLIGTLVLLILILYFLPKQPEIVPSL